MKGLAEEDVWFARHDRELIEALRRGRLAERAGCHGATKQIKARVFESESGTLERKHHRRPYRLFDAWRGLLARVRAACHPGSQ